MLVVEDRVWHIVMVIEGGLFEEWMIDFGAC